MYCLLSYSLLHAQEGANYRCGQFKRDNYFQLVRNFYPQVLICFSNDVARAAGSVMDHCIKAENTVQGYELHSEIKTWQFGFDSLDSHGRVIVDSTEPFFFSYGFVHFSWFRLLEKDVIWMLACNRLCSIQCSFLFGIGKAYLDLSYGKMVSLPGYGLSFRWKRDKE